MADSLTIPCNGIYTGYIVYENVDITSAACKMSFKLEPTTASTALFTLTNGDGLTMAEGDRTIDGTLYEAKYIVTFEISYQRALLLEGLQGYADLLVNNVSAGLFTWAGGAGVTAPPVSA